MSTSSEATLIAEIDRLLAEIDRLRAALAEARRSYSAQHEVGEQLRRERDALRAELGAAADPEAPAYTWTALHVGAEPVSLAVADEQARHMAGRGSPYADDVRLAVVRVVAVYQRRTTVERVEPPFRGFK